MKRVDLQRQLLRKIGTTLLMAAMLLLGACSNTKSPTSAIEILEIAFPTIPPVIESISPSSGTIGAEILIRGSGFTPQKNDIAFTHEEINFQGSNIAYLNEVSSPDGKTLRFTLPEVLGACAFSQMKPGEACPLVGIELPAGRITVTVVNRNGISYGVVFERSKSEREIAEEIIYNSPAYQKLSEILDEITRRTGATTAVEVGQCDGKICIKVRIERDVPGLSREIPAQIEGFEVKVEKGLLAPPGKGGVLSQFDINRNDLIDDPEFLDILEAWIAVQISDETFFHAIDLWLTQTPIS